jgi:NTP pyrophosphatase (non-canonical NTP hydrolase)
LDIALFVGINYLLGVSESINVKLVRKHIMTKPKEGKIRKDFEERFANWWWDYDPDTMTYDVVKEYVLSERKRMSKEWLNLITIEKIQNWEKSFTKNKKISQDEKTSSFIAITKLIEEVGETAKDLLEGNWKEIQAEVCDVIVFACKIANIAEQYHKVDKLNNVIKRKLGYCEKRVYDQKTKKLDKPDNKEFK